MPAAWSSSKSSSRTNNRSTARRNASVSIHGIELAIRRKVVFLTGGAESVRLVAYFNADTVCGGACDLLSGVSVWSGPLWQHLSPLRCLLAHPVANPVQTNSLVRERSAATATDDGGWLETASRWRGNTVDLRRGVFQPRVFQRR